jgi:hypothetical protein
MSNKWNRTYKLLVETKDSEADIFDLTFGSNVVITYPLTIEFNVSRHNLSSPNTATFTIYNLAEKTRKLIYKDPFNQDLEDRRAIQFIAGYNDGTKPILAMLFNGEVKSAYSERQGPNMKTEIECYCGVSAMRDGFVNNTLIAGLSYSSIMETLCNSLPTIQGSKISETSKQSKRKTVLYGNPAEITKEYTNNKFYIDEQKAYVLSQGDSVSPIIKEINSDSIIINTPRRSEYFVNLTILFEPRLVVGQYIKLNSSTEQNFNGDYQITGLSHTGTISGSVGGDCTTSISMINKNISQNLIQGFGNVV